MAKKYISVFCAVLICIISFNINVYAGKTIETEDKVSILESLDIISKKKPAKVTQNVMVESLMGFVYDREASFISKEDFARMYGFIDNTEKYNGNDTITAGNALKYCVKILGYDMTAKQKSGSIDDYVNIAANLGVTKGVSLKIDKPLEYADFIQIMYNMLDIEPMVLSEIQVGNNEFKVASGETLLSINRDIYKIKGIQTANHLTSIYSSNGSPEGTIYIDNVEYLYEKDVDFLGQKIEAYIQEQKNDSSSILYIRSVGEEILEISGQDVESVDENFRSIKYYNEKEKLMTVKLDDNLKVIFNGVFWGEYTTEDFKPVIGNIRLIDNNSDGRYEVAVITSYDIMFVSGVDEYNRIISNGLKYENSIDKLDMNDYDDYQEIYENGILKDMSSIQPRDILNVAISKDKKSIVIHISRKTKFGELKSLNKEDNELLIDGEKFEYSDILTSFMSKENKQLSTGINYTFFIDEFDNIVYFEKEKENEYYVFSKCYGNEMNDEYYVRCMDLDGVWNQIPLSKKIKINDTTYTAENAYNELNGLSTQVVLMSINAKGELKKIKIATETNVADDNKFTKYTYTDKKYHTPATFANTIYFSDDAKVILMPEDLSRRDKYAVYAPGEILANTRKYTFTAYNVDKFGFTDLVTIVDNANMPSAGNDSQWFIVSGKNTCLNSDDEVVEAIEGCYGGFLDIELMAEDTDVFKDVKKGDVLTLRLTKSGLVKKVLEKRYSLSEQPVPIVNEDFYENNNSILAGKVSDVDVAGGKLLVDCGSYGSRPFRLDASLIVKCYNVDTGKIRLTTASSLKSGDQIVCRMEYGIIQEMILREE